MWSQLSVESSLEIHTAKQHLHLFFDRGLTISGMQQRQKTAYHIAREALTQITKLKLLPTPANYQALYHEIAGIPKTPHVSTVDEDVDSGAITSEFLLQLAKLIECTHTAHVGDDGSFADQGMNLINALRTSDPEVQLVYQLLVKNVQRLIFATEVQGEIKAALLNLLHLVFENIGELSLNDQSLKGQMEALLAASRPPLTLRRLDDVERRLKDVIRRQRDAKEKVVLAETEIRSTLTFFIERLTQIAHSTGTFHEKLEDNARQIEHSKTLVEISLVLKDVVGATQEQLASMQERAFRTEKERDSLHVELDRVSAQVRHDPLTGALNRRGLDEAIETEVSTVRRKKTPLCMALLDIDNFKKLNDSWGHAIGDVALKHLTQVARGCMRPQDTLSRYGGEEFVVLLPDTPLEKGIEAMTRLQQELAKRFFLAGSEKVFITFSAGVAQMAEGEAGIDAIMRADQAMYLAKRRGKNRVLSA